MGGKFPRLIANAPSFNPTLNVNAPSFKMPPLPPPSLRMPPLPPDAPQDASASASAPPPALEKDDLRHKLISNDLKKKIRTQIEYYFSNENLHKDVYFRNQMDYQGWVSLEVLAQFNRVKSLLLYTNDPSVLYDALRTSKSLEVDTESGRTRRKDSSYSLGAIWAPFSTKGDIATIKSADSQEKGKGKKSKTGKGKGSPQANAGKDADATASPEKEKKDKPVPKDGEKKKGVDGVLPEDQEAAGKLRQKAEDASEEGGQAIGGRLFASAKE